jgi:endonuclease-3
MPSQNRKLEYRKKKALEVDGRLAAAFGLTLPENDRDVTHELIHAVLSQNTHRRNYKLAYKRLMDAFPDPAAIAAAPLTEIERAIRPGGLSNQKSRAIKSILASLAVERGDYSLEFLRGKSVGEAREFLTSLPGVGPKTASVVLMFADGRKVLPVDTHVLRTSRRLGLIDAKIGADKAQDELEALFPPPKRPRTHLNLVHLGREICHARSPRCEICPLNPVCDYYQGQGSSGR